MRVLLISPNTLTVPYPVYPIGLDYVASSIPAHHAVRIADCNVLSREALGELLSEYQPEVIGISCRNIDNTEAGDPLCFINVYKELVSWLRSRTQAILVCGGSGFNIMPEKILPYFDVDTALSARESDSACLWRPWTRSRNRARSLACWRPPPARLTSLRRRPLPGTVSVIVLSSRRQSIIAFILSTAACSISRRNGVVPSAACTARTPILRGKNIAWLIPNRWQKPHWNWKRLGQNISFSPIRPLTRILTTALLSPRPFKRPG